MPATITAPAPAATPAAAPAKLAPPAAGESSVQPSQEAIPEDLYGASIEIDAMDNQEVKPPKQNQVQKPKTEPKEKTVDDEIDELDPEKRVKPEGEEPEELEEAGTKPEEEEEKPEEQQEQIPTRAKDLKKVYEETKAAKKQLETKLAEATKRIDELQKTNPDEIKALSEKLAKAEARRDELEQKIRFTDYRESAEFKEKYAAPINEAWQRAITDLQETVVTVEDGSTRAAKVDDLVQLANMPLQQAARVAREMFGDAAEDILAHRRTIRELTIQQEKALERVKTDALERKKTEEVESRQKAERYQGLWKQEIETLGTKYPKWVKPVDGDEAGNKVLAAGYEEVDRFFGDQKLAPEDRLKLHAKIRMKAANHDRMALRLNRMAKTIKGLREKLSEFEASTPPSGKTTVRTSKAPGTGFDDVMAEIDSLDNPAIH